MHSTVVSRIDTTDDLHRLEIETWRDYIALLFLFFSFFCKYFSLLWMNNNRVFFFTSANKSDRRYLIRNQERSFYALITVMIIFERFINFASPFYDVLQIIAQVLGETGS